MTDADASFREKLKWHVASCHLSSASNSACKSESLQTVAEDADENRSMITSIWFVMDFAFMKAWAAAPESMV
jgi:hypothetical protein